MGRLLLLSVISTLAISGCRGEADAVLSDTVNTELLPAEHRSESGRAAEPDSFLDRIADLFGAGPKPQNKVHRPPQPGPVYRPKIPLQQSQASVQRPVKVNPPAGFNSFTNPGLQTSPSNIKRQTTGKRELL